MPSMTGSPSISGAPTISFGFRLIKLSRPIDWSVRILHLGVENAAAMAGLGATSALLSDRLCSVFRIYCG
jgi:hypothetical protein